MNERTRVLILGAAGRDFHNFNQVFRDDPRFEVVGFTATQIPQIADRVYPPALAGALYPKGIEIHPEGELESLVRERRVDTVIMAYSDVSHLHVMHLASRCIAAGADFSLLGGERTMLRARVPVIAVCAVRTGSGKSQTSRYATRILREAGRRPVVLRHPMPYGDLGKQRAQRIASYADLQAYECTIEEREEYEAYVAMGVVLYAGVDYAAILAEAQEEAEVIVWDGGNNDLPFLRPDLWITVADPLRAGHELEFHPGEANLRAADVIVVNKVNSAPRSAVEEVRRNAAAANPRAGLVEAASEVTAEDPGAIRGKRVLLVEDGPTLTHGGMPYGAGKVAAEKYGAREVVDPRPYAVGSIREVFTQYPQMGTLVPAMGYYPQQIADLEETLRRTPCDVVVVATPIDLGRIIRIDKPSVRVRYELVEMGGRMLADAIERVARQ
jgi:predicted GTPase